MKKSKQIAEILNKKKRSHKDVLYMITHDPILCVVFLFPLVPLIVLPIVTSILSTFNTILWIAMYPVLWYIIKNMSPRGEEIEVDYETLAPKRQQYRSYIAYALAYLKFVFTECKKILTKKKDN